MLLEAGMARVGGGAGGTAPWGGWRAAPWGGWRGRPHGMPHMRHFHASGGLRASCRLLPPPAACRLPPAACRLLPPAACFSRATAATKPRCGARLLAGRAAARGGDRGGTADADAPSAMAARPGRGRVTGAGRAWELVRVGEGPHRHVHRRRRSVRRRVRYRNYLPQRARSRPRVYWGEAISVWRWRGEVLADMETEGARMSLRSSCDESEVLIARALCVACAE